MGFFCQPCIAKTTFSFTVLIVLFICMGANKVVEAQAGRLPHDEGSSFSVYANVNGFSFC
jgi:hypothetical protein